MKVTDIDLRKMLSFEPESGRLLLGNERYLLFRQEAFAALRKLLFEQLGERLFRSILSQSGARNERVLHMAVGGVRLIQYRRHAALCIIGTGFGQFRLGKHGDFQGIRELERQGQTGGATADDQYVIIKMVHGLVNVLS